MLVGSYHFPSYLQPSKALKSCSRKYSDSMVSLRTLSLTKGPNLGPKYGRPFAKDLTLMSASPQSITLSPMVRWRDWTKRSGGSSEPTTTTTNTTEAGTALGPSIPRIPSPTHPQASPNSSVWWDITCCGQENLPVCLRWRIKWDEVNIPGRWCMTLKRQSKNKRDKQTVTVTFTNHQDR